MDKLFATLIFVYKKRPFFVYPYYLISENLEQEKRYNSHSKTVCSTNNFHTVDFLCFYPCRIAL